MSRALKRKANRVFEKIMRVIMLIALVILAIIFVYAQNNIVINSNYILESISNKCFLKRGYIFK